ncbi:hypothetical protein DMUE_1260 [Dictyocoela muelleri]|nr:hypothetical protein DMUE_1260 [Dictyocoela muelleri]
MISKNIYGNDKKVWITHLQKVVFDYNITKHSYHGKILFEVFYSRKPINNIINEEKYSGEIKNLIEIGAELDRDKSGSNENSRDYDYLNEYTELDELIKLEKNENKNIQNYHDDNNDISDWSSNENVKMEKEEIFTKNTWKEYNEPRKCIFQNIISK